MQRRGGGVRMRAVGRGRTSSRATKRCEGGFTLIELVLAMALLGVLAAVGFSVHGSFRERALKAEADASWQELSMAINLYRVENGKWPEMYTHAKNVG